jgi:hypothetical protein
LVDLVVGEDLSLLLGPVVDDGDVVLADLSLEES